MVRLSVHLNHVWIVPWEKYRRPCASKKCPYDHVTRGVWPNLCMDFIPSWSTSQVCLRRCTSRKCMHYCSFFIHRWETDVCSKERLGFWIPPRGLRTPGTGFHIFDRGTWIPDSCSSVFHIPKPRILDSTSKNFPDSRFDNQKFPGFWNPDSLMCMGRWCEGTFASMSCLHD